MEITGEKLEIVGEWRGTVDVNMEVWTLSMLCDHIALRSYSLPSSINLIYSGRLLSGNPSLSQLGLTHNSKILVTRSDSAKTEEEERFSRVNRLKDAVSALAKRHADGSLPVEDYDIQLENQKGQKINMGSETDRRAIMMGLMLHTKAKDLMAAQQFKDALELLQMGEEAFSLCDPTLLERVDNVSILQIDMVWCYFMLRDINLLSVAGERLAKAKKGFQLSHGKDGSRIRLHQSSRCPELALYLRLELLEGVAAFYSGNLEKSRQALTSAKDKFSKLQVSDEDLSLLMSMGYKQHEATRALKLNEQHVESAVNFLVKEKENKVKKSADNLKREMEIREQKKYGKTPLGKAVELQKLDALIHTRGISFEKELAAEVLRRHENDTVKALDDLTNPEGCGMDDSSSSSHGVEGRDAEIEDEVTHALGSKDAFSDYDIDITKEAEALNEYLTLLCMQ